MRFKFFAFLLFLSCIFNLVNAQKQQVFFLTNSGKQISNRDSCDYIRVIADPDSGSNLYGINEYYKNGKPKLIGHISIDKFGAPTFDGDCLRFYPSGKKQTISTYQNGVLTGHVYTFFPNGRLFDDKLMDIKRQRDPRYNIGFVVIASNDSTGKEMVINGTGHYVDYNDDFKWIQEEGDLKAGLKEGLWAGRFYEFDENGSKLDSTTFTERYEAGKLISGKSVGFGKTVYDYTEREVEPSFKNGLEGFNRWLTHSLYYPFESKRNNIEGKVYVSFVVEKDGSVTNVKVVRGPAEDMKQEALKVMQQSPKWIPGKQFGQPVRVTYTVPINFNLGN